MDGSDVQGGPIRFRGKTRVMGKLGLGGTCVGNAAESVP